MADRAGFRLIFQFIMSKYLSEMQRKWTVSERQKLTNGEQEESELPPLVGSSTRYFY